MDLHKNDLIDMLFNSINSDFKEDTPFKSTAAKMKEHEFICKYIPEHQNNNSKRSAEELDFMDSLEAILLEHDRCAFAVGFNAALNILSK